MRDGERLSRAALLKRAVALVGAAHVVAQPRYGFDTYLGPPFEEGFRSTIPDEEHATGIRRLAGARPGGAGRRPEAWGEAQWTARDLWIAYGLT